jgi:peptidoglycan-N-acetylglucosamine deacetylase
MSFKVMVMHPHLIQPHLLAVASLVTGGRLVTRFAARSPTLYLTFDDGPHPDETPRLLESLDTFDIKATFFVVGRAAEQHPDLVAAIARAGHAIGNHSMTHPRFSRLPLRHQLDEIASADRVLARHDGKKRHPFRPPYGTWTLLSMAACVLRSQKVVLWSHDSLDFRSPADQVVAHMRSRGGDILLFHDDGPVARESLQELVPEWKAAGFGFSTID